MTTRRNARSLRHLSVSFGLLLAFPTAVGGQEAYTHEIPIKLPAGTNGMQPSLSLEYLSGAGNGLLGVGWSLKGIPSITRVSYGSGITYGGNDTYAHSTLGVLVRQADGSYRTKNESFARAVPSGTCGDAPCSWTVADRSGTKFNFGTTADSRLERSVGLSHVRTWGLASVVDLFGNSYEVSYTNDASNGRLYPALVTYTKAAGLATYRTVEFAYEPRTDVEPGYALGGFEQTTQRLKSIVVKSNGVLVRKYRLDYECGDSAAGSCPGTQTGRSRLKALVEIGSDGLSALPPRTFGWQQGGEGFASASALPTDFTGRDGSIFQTGTELADLDGDGVLDLIQGWYNYGTVYRAAWINENGAWVRKDAFAPPADFAGRDGSASNGWDSGLRLVDVNGDGKLDLVQGWFNWNTSYRNAWINNGGQCSTTGCAWTPAPAYAPPADFAGRASGVAPWDGGLRLADLNGDGRLDLVLGLWSYGSSLRDAWINDGNGWARAPGYAPPVDAEFAGRGSGVQSPWDNGVRLADLDGDGRADLVKSLFSYGGSYRSAWINDGAGWRSTPALAPPQDAHFAGRASGVANWDGGLRIADLNADGKADLLLGLFDYGVSRRNAWVSTGSAWAPDSAHAPPAGAEFAGRASGVVPWDGGVRIADLNGDGKPDLVQSLFTYGTPVQGAWLNRSSGWSQAPAYSAPHDAAGNDVFFAGRASGVNPWDGGLRAADVNGDGKADLVLGLYSYGASFRGGWLNSTLSPDLVASVDNGLGGTVGINYAASTEVDGAIVPSSAGPGISNTRPRQLVTKVTRSDGRGGNYSIQYAYWDGRRFPGTIPNRRNLGFASVTIVDAKTGQYTKTNYNQSPGLERTAAQVDEWTSAGLLLKSQFHTYELVSPTGTTGVEWARETLTTASVWEGAGQSTTRQYDDYGNIAVVTFKADGSPDVSMATTYENDVVNWILGHATRVTATAGGTTLRDSVNVWTGNTITVQRKWLDTTASWLTTTMTYDTYGNLTSVTQPATGDGLTRKASTEFDATFRAYPVKLTNALGHVTQKTYNAEGSLASVADPNGHFVNISYDVFGRKIVESGPGDAHAQFAYLDYGNPNLQHNRVEKWVDATRVLWKEEYFDGTGFTYGVTSSGDCGTGWVVVEHEKDFAGRPYKTSQPHCSSDSPVWTTTEYDSAGRVARVTGPDGMPTTYEYAPTYIATTDANGRTTKRYFDARNDVTMVEDAASSRTLYGYDALQRLTSITLPDARVTRIYYDSLDRRTRVAEPEVGATTYAYDAVGNVTTHVMRGRSVSFTYDAANRVVAKRPDGDATVSYVYDEPAYLNGKGRLTTITDGTGTRHFSYSPSGKVAVAAYQIDGNTFTHQFGHDRVDRVTLVTYPNGSRAEYGYSNGGNLSTLTLDGAAIANWGTSYDAAGRPRAVTYGNRVASAYGYDAMGHLLTLSTTRDSTVLQDLTYDWYTRPDTRGLNIGSVTDNRANKACFDGSNTDETQVYSYDALYRLTRADGVWGSKSYAYSATGNPTTFGGRPLSYNGDQVAGGTGLAGVTYDPSGNMTHRVLDQVESTYAWTAEGRLATIVTDGRAAQMTYYDDGQRAKKMHVAPNGTTVTTTYVGPLYEKRTYSDGSPERHTLLLFANGQLVASVTKSGSTTTALNANGWRTEWALGAMHDPTTLGGAGERLLHVARALGAHPDLGRWAGGVGFAAVAAWILSGLALALRRRRFTRSISPVLRFAGSGVLITFGLAACNGAPVDRRAAVDPILMGDTLLGPSPGTFFYHRNQVSSSTVITDYSGGETRYVYEPFGEILVLNSCGTDKVTAKFTGKEYDEDTGLHYYGMRYYDPVIGRFLGPDPVFSSLTDAQSLNRYGYARNNPTLYEDPNGEFFFLPIVLFAATTALAAQVVWSFVDQAFFEGGLDPTSASAREEAWDDFGRDARGSLSGFDPTKKGTLINNELMLDLGLLMSAPWELPQSSLGYSFAGGMNLAGRVERVDRYKRSVVVDYSGNWDGAFTLGTYINLTTYDAGLVMHEYGHVQQSLMLGPLYIPVIAIPSLISMRLNPNGHESFWTERWADDPLGPFGDAVSTVTAYVRAVGPTLEDMLGLMSLGVFVIRRLPVPGPPVP